jgi:hypothetical protein
MTGKAAKVTPTGFAVETDPAVKAELTKKGTAGDKAEITITFTVKTLSAGTVKGAFEVS